MALPGLVPVRNPNGNAPQITWYQVDSAYGSAIGEGNLLIETTAGVELAGATVTNGTVLGVAAANVAASLSADTPIPVYDDPNQMFSIIADGAIADTNIIRGRFAGIVAGTNVYNSTLRQGNTQLDISVASGTFGSGLPLQIMEVLNNMADDLTAANVAVMVRIAAVVHFWTSQSGTTNRP